MNILHRMRMVLMISGALALIGVSGQAMATIGQYWQWTNPLPQGNDLAGIAYDGTGTYVEVGDRDAVLSSPDGVSWTPRSIGNTDNLTTVAWGNGKFVAAGYYNGSVYTSPDGVTWTQHSIGTPDSIEGIAWNGSKFVGVGLTGVILTSPDGVTWTIQVAGSSSSNTLLDVAWDGTQFVAVGVQGTIRTSPDGVTWTNQTSGTTSELQSVTAGGTGWVVVGNNGTILTSADGTLWTTRTSGTTLPIYGVTWGVSGGTGTYVAVGFGMTLTSTDGVSWSQHTHTYNWYDVLFDGNQFVAVGLGGDTATSSDASSWTPSTQNLLNIAGLSNRPSIQALDWLSSVKTFVAVSDSPYALASPDGVNWSVVNTGAGNILTGLTCTGTECVAVGSTILTTSNGTTWTQQTSGTSQGLNAITWTGSQFVVVGNNGTILTSPDGVTWTAQTSGTTETLSGVGAGGGLIVATGFNGTILTSPDGINWTAQSSGTTSVLAGVSYGAGTFVVASYSGNALTSTDGVNWTAHMVDYMGLRPMRWDGTEFLTASEGKSYASPDGVNWSGYNTVAYISANAIATNDNSNAPIEVMGGYNGDLIASILPATLGLQDVTVAHAGTGREAFTIQGMGALTVAATSSDQTLLPDASISGASSCTGAGGCTLTLQPAADQAGTATVTVTVTDSHGQSGSGTFQITENPPAPPTVSGFSGNPITQPNSGSETFAVSGTGALTVTASSSDQTLLPDANITGASSCTAAGNCSLTLQPAADKTGTATVTVSVSDAYGQSASGTFQVTVNAPAAPAESGFSNITVKGTGGSETFTIAGTGALVVSTVSSNQTLLPNANITGASSCTAAGSCSLKLQPASNRSGTATVTVKVTDAYGQSAAGSFDVTVQAVSSGGGSSGSGSSGGGGSFGWLMLAALALLGVFARRRTRVPAFPQALAGRLPRDRHVHIDGNT